MNYFTTKENKLRLQISWALLIIGIEESGPNVFPEMKCFRLYIPVPRSAIWSAHILN